MLNRFKLTVPILLFSARWSVASLGAALVAGHALEMAGVHFPNPGSHDALPLRVLVWFGALIFSPLVETLALAWGVRLLVGRLGNRGASMLSGLMLAVVHGGVFWAWGVISLGPALIFSMPFARPDLVSEERFARSFYTHAFHNAAALVLAGAAD